MIDYEVLLFRKERCYREKVIQIILDGRADDIWYKGRKIFRMIEIKADGKTTSKDWKLYKEIIKDKKDYKFLIILKKNEDF